MPYRSCSIRRLPRTPYYIIPLTFSSNLTDAAIQCCCVITAQADKRLFRAASKNRRKIITIYAYFCYILNIQRFSTRKLLIKQ